MLKNIMRTADESSVQSLLIGALLAALGVIGSVAFDTIIPVCLGLSAYFVGCWPLIKRFGLVAFTGRYPK